METNIMGIYKITNKANNKVYIGSSKDIQKRWKQHINTLKNKTHHSYHLQRAWNKYGDENFKFEIVEVVYNEDILTVKEQEWMDKTNCCDFKFGYNMSYDATRPTNSRYNSRNSYMLPKDSLLSLNELKISMSLRGLFYSLCSLCGENNLLILDEKPMSSTKICNYFNLDRKTLYDNIKKLENYNLVSIKVIGKNNNTYINPSYFIGSVKIDEETYNMFKK